MADRLATGEILVNLNSRAAEDGLLRLRADYKSAMAEIDRMRAAAKVTADTSELDRKIAEAKDKVRQLKGERASVTAKADIKQLSAKVKEAEREVARLDGKKATIEVKTRGDQVALAQLERVAKVEQRQAAARARMSAAEARQAQQADRELMARGRLEAQAIAENERREQAAYTANMRRVNAEARVSAALNNQRIREERAVEQAVQARGRVEAQAYAENERRDRAAAEAPLKRAVAVSQLEKQYARLTDRIERLDKRARGVEGSGLQREITAKLHIERRGALAEMAKVKAEMSALGAHPPVDVKIDTDRSDMNIAKRAILGLRDEAGKVGSKGLSILGNVGDIRVMGNSLRTVIGVAAGLSPILVSLGGAATSLVGVLGTGLAGAAAVAGGTLSGLALNFGGVLLAMKPALADFKLAQQATQAYTKAVDKYGASSKQAKTAQEQMNSVLKSVDPNARRAAIGVAQIQSEWGKLTQPTARRDVGQILAGGIKAASALMPTFARNTNATFDILTQHMTHLEGRLSKPANVHIFDSLGQSANKFLNPALSGLGHLGAAFAHIGESAARIFAGPAGNAFERWAKGIDNATKPGAKLDATIRRLGNDARDVGRFFMDAGRLIGTVLNGSSKAGDNLVNTMDDALQRWNAFLKTPGGKQGMQDFFSRSADDAKALWGALAPLVASFVQWSSLLAPFTTGILKGIGAVGNLVAGFTRLVGLGGPLTAFGATIGVAFAVGKLAAFAGMIARIVSLLRDAARAGSVLGAIKTFGGGIGGAIKGPGSMAGAGAAAGAEIASSMEAAGAVVAAEIGGAMRGAGALGAAEGAAGKLILPAGVGAATGEVAALGAAGEAAGAGILGLGAAGTAIATGGLALLAGAAVYGAVKLLSMKSAGEKLSDAIKANQAGTRQWAAAQTAATQTTSNAGMAMHDYRQSVQNVVAIKRQLSKIEQTSGRDSQAYRDKLAELNMALGDRATKEQQVHKLFAQASEQQQRATAASNKRVTAENNLKKALQEQKDAENEGGGRNAIKRQQDMADAAKNVAAARHALAGYTREQTTAERQALVAQLDYQRGLKGMIPLTEAAGRALAKLSRTNPNLSAKINVKYADPKDAGGVAAKAQQALGKGVSVQTVMHIVADSRNAEDAIKRLNAAEIKQKRLVIHGDEQDALAALAHLRGQNLPTKVMRLVGDAQDAIRKHGIVAALPAIRKLMAVLGNNAGALHAYHGISGLANLVKSLQMIGQDAGARSLYNSLGSLPDITKQFIMVRSEQLRGRRFAVGGANTQESKRLDAMADSAGPPMTTRGGSYRRPTLLVGEESRTEYVIATNPAYRYSNRLYLQQAAAELGMRVTDPRVTEMAAGGAPGASAAKHKPKHRPGKPGPGKGQPAKIELVDPPKLTGDYIEETYNDVSSALNKFAKAHERDQAKIVSAHRRISAATDQLHHTKPGHTHDVRKKKLDQMQKDFDKLQADDRKQQRNYRTTLPRFRKLKGIYDNYEVRKNDADRFTSDMNVAATHYNHGDPPPPGSDWLTEWRKARDNRVGALADVKTDLQNALQIAGPKWDQALKAQIAGIDSDSVSTADEDAPSGPAAGPTGFEDLLRIGAFGPGLNMDVLSGLNAQLALAGTTPDTGDDVAVANQLVGFYQAALGRAGGIPGLTGEDRNNLIGEIAGDLKDAQSTAGQAASTGGVGTDDAQAQLAQAQAQATVAQATVATQAAFIQTALSPGDIGSGSGYSTAWSQSGGVLDTPNGTAGRAAEGFSASPSIVVHQTVQTLHPGDPATLRAVGDAAAAGFGYQGNVASSREYTGL